MRESEVPLQFDDLPVGKTYFAISSGKIFECVKVDEYCGRKVNGRKGKISHWLNKNVFMDADAAQGYLDSLLESGRRIVRERKDKVEENNEVSES